MAFMKNARKKKDIGIYGKTAEWYDKNSRKSRLAEMYSYADMVEKRSDHGAAVLEVAPGPGYLSVELARRGFTVTGVEISQDFVDIEKRNAKEAAVTVDFRQGNASALPLPDNSFDFVVCSAAFKNFKEPIKAMNEMYRVLKQGGTALILDMNHDATNEDIESELKRTGMKGFDRVFVKFTFRTFLRNGAYTRDGLEMLIAESEFSRHEIIKYGIGFQIWLYK
jgi:Methylase involved in ubiquinone/menaquinone biosynthesis